MFLAQLIKCLSQQQQHRKEKNSFRTPRSSKQSPLNIPSCTSTLMRFQKKSAHYSFKALLSNLRSTFNISVKLLLSFFFFACLCSLSEDIKVLRNCVKILLKLFLKLTPSRRRCCEADRGGISREVLRLPVLMLPFLHIAEFSAPCRVQFGPQKAEYWFAKRDTPRSS